MAVGHQTIPCPYWCRLLLDVLVAGGAQGQRQRVPSVQHDSSRLPAHPHGIRPLVAAPSLPALLSVTAKPTLEVPAGLG